MKLSLGGLALVMFSLCLTNLLHSTAAEVIIGNFTSLAHGVQGQVVALSESVFEVRGMRYDGSGPAAYFWADTSETPSPNGFRLYDSAPPSDSCGMAALPSGGDRTFRFEFPEGQTVNDIAGGSISVWCELANANFGHVAVDSALLTNLDSTVDGPPLQCSGDEQDAVQPVAQEIVLGSFQTRQHGVRGEVVALSDRVLEVRNYFYDGAGPDAYFWADTSSRPSDGGFRLLDGAPSDRCGERRLGRADGETVRFEFPEGQSLQNEIRSISVWCENFEANFGEVVVDPSLLDNLASFELGQGPDLSCGDNSVGRPPEVALTPDGYNCESLNDDFQVRWKVDAENQEIQFELLGRIDEDVYMGFGVSGSETRANMLGADPVVADFFNGEFRARDYYLSERAQCSTFNGACPDADRFVEDISTESVSGERAGSFTLVRYRRPFAPADVNEVFNGLAVDHLIDVTPGALTSIIWALGPVDTASGNPFFHRIDHSRELIQFEFGRSVANNCEVLMEVDEEEEEIFPFFRPVLADENEFRAVIGPAGGDRGFASISDGLTAWGIAWYLNDLLIPVVEMRRGQTYKFLVSGGNDPSSSSEFHPFYLTDSNSGGYNQLNGTQQAAVRVFGGVEILNQTQNEVLDFEFTAVAPLCDYIESPESSEAAECGFPFYFTTLDTSCAADQLITDQAAELEFTPDETTPDTIYYQCGTHTNLGWKIHVIDADAPSIQQVECSNFGSTPIRLTNELTLNAIIDPVLNTMKVELVYDGLAWVGMAFTDGSPIMVGAEAVIGLPDEPNSLQNPAKYDLNRREVSGVVRMSDEMQTLKNATIIQTESQTILSFTKLLIEPDEHPIFTDKANTFLFAHGSDNDLGFHSRFGSIEFRPNQCEVTVLGEVQNEYALDWQGVVGVEEPDLNRNLWMAHGICASIAWAILVPLAVGASLIRKVLVKIGLAESAWFQIHRVLNSLAAILTLIAFSLAVHAINDQTPSGESADHFSTITHHRTGLVIFVFTMAQALNGIFRPHLPHSDDEEEPSDQVDEKIEAPQASTTVKADETFPGEPKSDDDNDDGNSKKSSVRQFWEIFHRLLGATLLGLTWWQVQDGLGLFALRFDEENMDFVFWIVVTVIAGTIGVLAVFQRVAL